MRINDPIEQIVADALAQAGIAFRHDSDGNTNGLDFYLPDHDVYIEVKAYHSDWITTQMKRAENIILIQGKHAALTFARLLRNTPA